MLELGVNSTGVHATVQREKLEDTYCTEQERRRDRPPSHYSRPSSGNQRLTTFAATKTCWTPLKLLLNMQQEQKNLFSSASVRSRFVQWFKSGTAKVLSLYKKNLKISLKITLVHLVETLQIIVEPQNMLPFIQRCYRILFRFRQGRISWAPKSCGQQLCLYSSSAGATFTLFPFTFCLEGERKGPKTPGGIQFGKCQH